MLANTARARRGPTVCMGTHHARSSALQSVAAFVLHGRVVITVEAVWRQSLKYLLSSHLQKMFVGPLSGIVDWLYQWELLKVTLSGPYLSRV